MNLTFLGTGTSHGVPVIGCDCPVCSSKDTHDQRLRSSVLISDKKENSETNILIDCGPEFRIQCLKYGIKKITAVLLTHSHADHLHGIDDLRVFSCLRSKDDPKKTDHVPLNIFANEGTIKDFTNRFDYLFKPVIQGGGRALVQLTDTAGFSKEKPLMIDDIAVYSIPMFHGNLKTNGYVMRKEAGPETKTFAYLTDVNRLPEESFELLENFGNIDHLVIDGLRVRPHSTHFSFAEALEAADKIGAQHTWLTHLCHDTSHQDCIKWIADHLAEYPRLSNIKKSGGSIAPAYDGLQLE